MVGEALVEGEFLDKGDGRFIGICTGSGNIFIIIILLRRLKLCVIVTAHQASEKSICSSWKQLFRNAGSPGTSS